MPAAPSYPGRKLENTTQTIPDTGENKLSSVSNSFGLLPSRTDYIAFREGDVFPSNEYTEIENHFQGITRLKDGQHFVISGGSKKDKKANLILCKAEYYGIRPNSSKFYGGNRIESAIGSNILWDRKVPGPDIIVDIFQINVDLPNVDNTLFWHAGGMDICGDILAVPLENSKDQKSFIRFYNFAEPTAPKRIEGSDFELQANSGGVALTKRADDRFLCASWTDSDDSPDRFDFYISKNPNDLTEWEEKITYDYRSLTPVDNGNPKFQAINFIPQKDGKLFLIGTENSNKYAPVLKGKDRAHLYEVIFYENGDGDSQFHLIKISQRDFEGGGSYSNFGAASGIYLNE